MQKFDRITAREIEAIVVWCSKERGRIQRLTKRINTMLEEDITVKTVLNWLRPNPKDRAEPRLSTGLALIRAFQIEKHSTRE